MNKIDNEVLYQRLNQTQMPKTLISARRQLIDSLDEKQKALLKKYESEIKGHTKTVNDALIETLIEIVKTAL